MNGLLLQDFRASRSKGQPHNLSTQLRRLQIILIKGTKLLGRYSESSILEARITYATSGSRVWPVILHTTLV